jgi:hypothetical protein
LAARVLGALKEDDFRVERFEYISRIHEANLRNNDRLVFGAYTSFRDFDLWNAWFRVWALGVGLGDLKLASIYRRYLKTHDDSILPDAEEPMGLFYSQHKGFGELLDAAVAKMDEVEAGTTDPKEASKYIFSLIRNAKFTPAANHLGDPDWHFINAGTLHCQRENAAVAVYFGATRYPQPLVGITWKSRKQGASSSPRELSCQCGRLPLGAATVTVSEAFWPVCGFQTVTVS